jgi:hypothetical protein
MITPAPAESSDRAEVAAASAASIVPPRAAAFEAAFDLGAIGLARLGHLHDPVDEQAQAHLGRHAPGAGVRRGEQAGILQFLKHRADRGGERLTPPVPASVLEPTGWPEAI